MTEVPIQDHTESEALWFFEAARLGITTKEAIVSWADSRIMLLEAPPYWLIELSTCQSRDVRDHASIIAPHLAAKLPSDALISLVLDAQANKAIAFDQALALLFQIFSPTGEPAPEGFPEPISELLVEMDCMEFDVPLSEDFLLRCELAFADHRKRHCHPPSAIFHPPSPI